MPWCSRSSAKKLHMNSDDSNRKDLSKTDLCHMQSNMLGIGFILIGLVMVPVWNATLGCGVSWRGKHSAACFGMMHSFALKFDSQIEKLSMQTTHSAAFLFISAVEKPSILCARFMACKDRLKLSSFSLRHLGSPL